MSYLKVTEELYKEASQTVQEDLCCVEKPLQFLPDLHIPDVMTAMDYGCGTTVYFGELSPQEDILYVGVGGGLEALQFSYVTRRPGAVIAVDRVPEMIEKAKQNFAIAEEQNSWFQSDFIKVLAGDALALPLADESVDVAAQNCLFNIFKGDDLLIALKEIYRVLKPGGRLYISDPITSQPIPEALRDDERLRAMCLSGALSLKDYVQKISDAGFDEVQVRARRPYRLLDRYTYGVDDILLETVELVAVKGFCPQGETEVFLGESAIYKGKEKEFLADSGTCYKQGIPVSVSVRVANQLRENAEFAVTAPTYHYIGYHPAKAGCCCCG